MSVHCESASLTPVAHLNHQPLSQRDATGIVVVTVDELRNDPTRALHLRTACGRMQRHLWDRETWSLDPFMLHTVLKGLVKAGMPGMRVILDNDSLRGMRIRETYVELEADPAAISIAPGSTEDLRAIVFGTSSEAIAVADFIWTQSLLPTDYRHEQVVGHLRPAWRQQRDKGRR